MTALGKDVGSGIITRANLAAAAGGSAVNGQALDITGLGARANSVRGVIAVKANLDSGDSINVSAIKLQSSADSAFTTPVDRVTATDVVLTGASGDDSAAFYDEATLDLDLTTLPSTHKYLRLTATPTLSDTTNATGAIGGVLVFGGLSEAPAT